MIIYNNAGNKVLEIEVDDNSYRNRAVMGDHSLTLYYSLPEHVEIPVGSYCEFQGETFTLKRPENFKMKHKRLFEYTVLFDPPEANAKVWKFRNPVDGRLKFSLTAKPHEHLQMFVDNMNRRDKGWTVGECIDGVETLIAYDHDFCIDALQRSRQNTSLRENVCHYVRLNTTKVTPSRCLMDVATGSSRVSDVQIRETTRQRKFCSFKAVRTI